MFTWVTLKDNVKQVKILLTITGPCSNPEFRKELRKKKLRARKNWAFLRGPTIWKVMSRNVWNIFVNWQSRLLINFIRYQLHVLMTINSKKKNWNPWEKLSNECFQIVLKCLNLARLGRPDILWTVNKLTRAITKWARACDKRLARLISCIHFTSEHKQCCHVGKTVQQFRFWQFQDFDTAGDLEDSKSTSGGTLCVFGSHTFVPISWMCKN